MDKPAQRYKSKNKKSASKPKTTKKRKSDTKPECGPSCSMFLAEITKKLAARRQQAEDCPKNIVQTIIDSLTNALPIKFSKKEKKASPMIIETLQSLAPELLPNDTLEIPKVQQPIEQPEEPVLQQQDVAAISDRTAFKMPKMPLISSEVIKIAIEKGRKSLMQDASMNTGEEHDMATELVKHVSTLRKISLIAEEFNQKTAKNLKEIVDSVQEDLVKKLEEIQAEQSAAAAAQAIQEAEKETEQEE